MRPLVFCAWMVHNIPMPDKSPRPTIREVLATTAPELQPRRIVCDEDRDLGRLEAELFLATIFKKDRAWLRIHDDSILTASRSKAFAKMVARRKKHEPVAYILGHKEFFGLDFIVDKRVLIPRPESELIVERVLEILKQEPSSGDVVWDIGTGSGAIAIAVAAYIAPRRVIASDKGTLISIHQQRFNILRSTDGGKSWQEAHSYQPADIKGGAQGLRDGAFGLVAP